MLFYANILLSNDCPLGKKHAHNRKKGDYFHSIAVFTNQNIKDMKIGETTNCFVIHFHGENGHPVLDEHKTTVTYFKQHFKDKIYTFGSYEGSYGIIGDIKTKEGYEEGYGCILLTPKNISKLSFDKWGHGQIPYSHNRNESYNCVAFVDDILHRVKYGVWNSRIEQMHEKHRLI